MKIDFGHAVLQAVQRRQKVLLGHLARIQQPFDLTGITNPAQVQFRPTAGRKPAEDEGVGSLADQPGDAPGTDRPAGAPG